MMYNLILEYIDKKGNRLRKFLMKSTLEAINRCIFNTKEKGIFFVYEEGKSKPLKIRKKL